MAGCHSLRSRVAGQKISEDTERERIYRQLGRKAPIERGTIAHQDVLATLDTMTTFSYEHPQQRQPKLHSPQAVMDAFPDVCLVIDAKEQHLQRPKNCRDDEGNVQDQQGYDGIHKDYPDVAVYLPHKARRNHPLTEEQKAYNRHLARYRIVVEHTMAQLNKFQVLAQVFRHKRDTHGQLVRIVAGLVNRRIQVVPLKTYALA